MATTKSTAAAADEAAKAKAAEQEAADKAAADKTKADAEAKAKADAEAAPTSTTEAGTPPDEGTNDASAGVKARRASARDVAATDRVPTQTFDYGDKARDLTPEQVEAQNGLPTFHQGGPDTSVTNLAGSHVGLGGGRNSEYVIPDDHGFIAYVPENAKQPVTIRIWTAGQAVKRSVHEHYQDLASTTPEKAKILDAADVLHARR
jgi:hypothetical protein